MPEPTQTMGQDTDQPDHGQQGAPKPSAPSYRPPASQADLDRIIADRLDRERKKFADYAELKQKAARLEAIEAEKLSAEEKLRAQVEAAEKKLAAYQHAERVAGWVDEVVEETGLDSDLKAALRGETLEEIREQAEILKAYADKVQGPPTDHLLPTLGRTPETPGNYTLAEQIAAAEKAGDAAMVAQLKAVQLGAAAPFAYKEA